MSISAINFKSSQPADFQSLINRPQTHQMSPAAASGLQYGANTKKSHALRNTVVGAAVIGTTLAVLAKKGKLDYSGENKILQNVSKYAKLAGNKIADCALKLKDKLFGTSNSNNMFVDAPVIGTDRSAEAVKAFNKSAASDKLAKAQAALEKATDEKVKAAIQTQIDKLTTVVNG